MEDLEKKLKEKFCTEGTFYWLWKETHSVDDVCKFIKENYQSKSIPMQAGVKPANDNHAIKYAINELTTLEGLLLEAKEMDAKTLNKAISILSQLRNRLHNRLSV